MERTVFEVLLVAHSIIFESYLELDDSMHNEYSPD
jgi:hypothetical protein